MHANGSQTLDYGVRADCVAEIALLIALGNQSQRVASEVHVDLLRYLYIQSDAQRGPRANASDPNFGLILWGLSPGWTGKYYADDMARVLLGTMTTTAMLTAEQRTTAGLQDIERNHLWGILANLRTQGSHGFRADRFYMDKLYLYGWKYYAELPIHSTSPHFQSWIWAVYLHAYRHTQYQPFLELARRGLYETYNLLQTRELHWAYSITAQ
ncbi:MAG TPA: hypothetical protein V6D20_19435, partial [Candidatus Obscuribacterales bacterium]